jgi:hypothetical protein
MEKPSMPALVDFLNKPVTPEITIDLQMNLREVSLQNAQPDTQAGFRPFMNNALNGRAGSVLPSKAWTVETSMPLGEGLYPRSLLCGRQCVLVLAEGIWQLFSDNGSTLASGTSYSPSLFIDYENNLVFSYNQGGSLLAHTCADGKKSFIAMTSSGASYRRDFTARTGNKIVSVAVEEILDKRAKKKAESSILEILDLGDPIAIDDEGVARSAKTTALLTRQSARPILTVVQADAIYCASDNVVYELDLDLAVKKQLNAVFIPHWMSIDEYGRIHLVVSVEPDAKRCLWIFSSDGEISTAFDLPKNMYELIAPPIIGHDHRVYCVSEHNIYSIESNGDVAWVRKAQHALSGALVTGDDYLIVSDGPELAAFDSFGQRYVLYTFEEPLVTPPLLTASGILYAASQTKLYKLTPEKE